MSSVVVVAWGRVFAEQKASGTGYISIQGYFWENIIFKNCDDKKAVTSSTVHGTVDIKNNTVWAIQW